MSKLLHAIKDASIQEIEIDGLFWRIRRVASSDLAKVGFAWLSFATPENGEDPDVDMNALLKRANESKLIELAKLKDAIICAGLVAIGHDGNWDDCQVTLRQSEENIENGVIWIGSLPANADNELFTAIMNLSTEGGKAGEILANFRASTGNVDSIGRNKPPLRNQAG